MGTDDSSHWASRVTCRSPFLSCCTPSLRRMWNEGQGQPVSAKQYASYDPGVGPENAEEAAGCCSRTFFVWVYALVSLGNEKQLDESDVWLLHSQDNVKKLLDRFHATRASLDAKARIRADTTNKPYKPASLFQIFSATLICSQVGLINVFLDYFLSGSNPCLTPTASTAASNETSLLASAGSGPCEDRYPQWWFGWMLVLLLFANVFLYMVSQNAATYISTRTALHIKATTSAMVFQKGVRLSPSARNKSTMGQILNYMQVDAENLMMASLFAPKFVSLLLQIVVWFTILVVLIGWPAIFAITFQAIAMPCAVFFFTKQASIQGEKMKYSDQRTKLVNEIFQAIRVVKFYAWEDSFMGRIGSVRQKELDLLFKLGTVKAKASVFTHASPAFMIAIIFTLVAYNRGGRLVTAH